MNLFTFSAGAQRRRQGLTLIELVVVMVILIALAGILLPLFPSMLTRAHTSTTATNISEATKAVNLYYNLYSAYPNNLDNLVPTGGAAIANYVAASAAATDLTVYPLTAADLTALNNAGITSVLPIIASPGAAGSAAAGAWNPTFNPYSINPITTVALPQANAVALAVGTNVTGVTQGAVTRELGLVAAGNSTANPATYVMFGLGNYSTAAGRTVAEAPYHFDDGAGGSPDIIYGRFGMIFQTQDGSGTALPNAKFIGVVDLADATGITDASDHVQTYFQLQQNNQ